MSSTATLTKDPNETVKYIQKELNELQAANKKNQTETAALTPRMAQAQAVATQTNKLVLSYDTAYQAIATSLVHKPEIKPTGTNHRETADGYIEKYKLAIDELIKELAKAREKSAVAAAKNAAAIQVTADAQTAYNNAVAQSTALTANLVTLKGKLPASIPPTWTAYVSFGLARADLETATLLAQANGDAHPKLEKPTATQVQDLLFETWGKLNAALSEQAATKKESDSANTEAANLLTKFNTEQAKHWTEVLGHAAKWDAPSKTKT